MNEMIVEQGRIFLYANVLAGFAVLIYDLLRVFRRSVPHNSVFLNLEDLIYFFGLGFSFFIYVFRVNRGEVRGYIVLGFLLGVTIYYGFLSRHVIHYITFIVKKVFFPIMRLIKRMLWPIIKLGQFGIILIRWVKIYLQNVLKWIIIRIRSILKELCNIVKYK